MLGDSDFIFWKKGFGDVLLCDSPDRDTKNEMYFSQNDHSLHHALRGYILLPKFLIDQRLWQGVGETELRTSVGGAEVFHDK